MNNYSSNESMSALRIKAAKANVLFRTNCDYNVKLEDGHVLCHLLYARKYSVQEAKLYFRSVEQVKLAIEGNETVMVANLDERLRKVKILCYNSKDRIISVKSEFKLILTSTSCNYNNQESRESNANQHENSADQTGQRSGSPEREISETARQDNGVEMLSRQYENLDELTEDGFQHDNSDETQQTEQCDETSPQEITAETSMQQGNDAEMLNMESLAESELPEPRCPQRSEPTKDQHQLGIKTPFEQWVTEQLTSISESLRKIEIAVATNPEPQKKASYKNAHTSHFNAEVSKVAEIIYKKRGNESWKAETIQRLKTLKDKGLQEYEIDQLIECLCYGSESPKSIAREVARIIFKSKVYDHNLPDRRRRGYLPKSVSGKPCYPPELEATFTDIMYLIDDIYKEPHIWHEVVRKTVNGISREEKAKKAKEANKGPSNLNCDSTADYLDISDDNFSEISQSSHGLSLSHEPSLSDINSVVGNANSKTRQQHDQSGNTALQQKDKPNKRLRFSDDPEIVNDDSGLFSERNITFEIPPSTSTPLNEKILSPLLSSASHPQRSSRVTTLEITPMDSQPNSNSNSAPILLTAESNLSLYPSMSSPRMRPIGVEKRANLIQKFQNINAVGTSQPEASPFDISRESRNSSAVFQHSNSVFPATQSSTDTFSTRISSSSSNIRRRKKGPKSPPPSQQPKIYRFLVRKPPHS